MDKPLTVLREEFIDSLVKLVNESGLPMFAVESVLRELCAETKAAAARQYEMDKAKYDENIKENEA